MRCRGASIACIVILLAITAAPLTVNAYTSHHTKCKPPATQLFVYTFPVQNESVILKHYGNTALQNKSNTDYNAAAVYNVQQFQAGKAAGERNSQGVNFTSWSCPAGHTKDFCRGWDTSSCSSAGCNGDFTCDRWNDTKGCPHNR